MRLNLKETANGKPLPLQLYNSARYFKEVSEFNLTTLESGEPLWALTKKSNLYSM